ncbi:hypothetical protein [Flindersiella endophytica]
MGIGTGVFLIAAGSVLLWAIDADLPYIEDDTLGLILLVAGIAVLVISVVMKVDRPEAGVGTGVFLIAAGAVLSWAIDADLPYIADYVLGTTLIVAGAISICATLALSLQRRRERQRAYEQRAAFQPPPSYAPQAYQQQPYQQQPYQQQQQPYGQQQQPYPQDRY